jgi:secreted trypsin-like serine protease
LPEKKEKRMRRTIALLTTMAMTLLMATSVAMAATGDGGGSIVGGTDVPTGKYPFVVSILDKTRGATAYEQHWCGASLLNKDHVLTAAHCVKGKLATNLRVAVGRTYLDSTQGQVRNVVRINIHPSYSYVSSGYDVAVLKLSSAVIGITPIRVTPKYNNVFETPGRSLTVAGWGNTQYMGDTPQNMSEAQVPVVSDATADTIYLSYVPSLMVAAGEEGVDTCQGDSGGPMFTRVSTSTGVVYYQVGITSFGTGCGEEGYPGVYTEVNNPNVFDFIYWWAADGQLMAPTP